MPFLPSPLHRRGPLADVPLSDHSPSGGRAASALASVRAHHSQVLPQCPSGPPVSPSWTRSVAHGSAVVVAASSMRARVYGKAARRRGLQASDRAPTVPRDSGTYGSNCMLNYKNCSAPDGVRGRSGAVLDGDAHFLTLFAALPLPYLGPKIWAAPPATATHEGSSATHLPRAPQEGEAHGGIFGS